jgi:uncharacterized protein
MSWISENPEGFVLTLFVQPRSSRNMIAGLHGQALKIRLTAPPVDNAANRMCVQYLSKCLNVPKSAIEILTGQTGRTKQVLVRVPNDGREAMRKKIETFLD